MSCGQQLEETMIAFFWTAISLSFKCDLKTSVMCTQTEAVPG